MHLPVKNSACQQPVKHFPQRVDICCRCNLFRQPVSEFGGHIPPRPNCLIEEGKSPVLVRDETQTEVAHDRIPQFITKKDVPWFEVPVNHSHIMSVSYSATDPQKKPKAIECSKLR